MNELAVLEAFLRSVFLADELLLALIGDRVYSAKPKAGALGPYVVMSYVPGRDATNSAGAVGRRIWLQPLYQVKACCRSADFADADAVALELDRVLSGLQDSFVYGGVTYRVTSLAQQGALRYAEPGGTEYRWSGFLVRFIVEVDD